MSGEEEGCASCSCAEDYEADVKEEAEERQRDIALIALGLALTVPIFIIETFFESRYVPFVLLALAAPVQFLVGWKFYVGTRQAITNRSLDMNVLVVTSTSVAFVYSVVTVFTGGVTFFEVSAAVITLVSIGEYLEEVSRRRVSYAVRKLMQLQPKTARITRNGDEVELPISEVVVGDKVLVKPGERIPVDGSVIEGDSSVDESLITGESMPVDKTPGMKVIGGTINRNGILRIEAMGMGEHSALSQIIRLVREAQSSKAPIQRVADRVISYFVPLVFLISLLTFFLWFFALDASLSFSLTAAITVLVIACPCALGIAVPTVILVATGKGAEMGILFKKAEAVETAGRISIIAFDKTGTLTKGEPSVTDIVASDASNAQEVLEVATMAECSSDHPIAKAVMRASNDAHIHAPACISFRAVPGFGVEGKHDGRKILVGNNRLMGLSGLSVPTYLQDKADALERQGKTLVAVAVDNEVIGLLALADTIKADSVGAVNELIAMGVATVMITGDNERTASSVASQVGIQRVMHGVTPPKKALAIKTLKKDGFVVAMVGDGINDAPALAESDVGIAIGTGTDVAIETGDIVLIRGNLKDVVRAIDLSKKAMSKIRQNLAFSFLYNGIGMAVAAGVLFPLTHSLVLTPVLAAVAEVISDFVVIGNALLLRRYTPM